MKAFYTIFRKLQEINCDAHFTYLHMKTPLLFIIFYCLLNECGNSESLDKTDPDLITADHKITYEEWKEDAKTDSRLFPKVGNVVKNES